METFSSTSAPWGTFERLTRAQFAEFHQAGIASLHAQLLFNRNICTSAAMHAFLDANLDTLLDPHLLIDMDRALSRIQQALSTHERITVYGDFDADGVTSAALVTRVLRRLGQPEELLSHFIPSRIKGTRGLYKEAIDDLLANGTSLIITTDCGSSDVEEVAYAQSLGIDVIITDHHHPPTQLPLATAMLNPWRPDSTYSERYLCGVGIAFKLAQGLFQAYGLTINDLRPLLDLVAIGTVGDVAALLGENHALVRAGMQQLNRTENPGLQALIQLSKLQPGRIRERDISFALAPRINAAGRMADADLAFRLLTISDSKLATELAEQLEDLNFKRQNQTEDLMKLVREQAALQADKQVVLVSGEKEFWPEGIIGLVAGKLSEEIQRPVFVLSQDTEFSRGSARCQENFNIILALRSARPGIFERYGGHAQAAGFTIANANITELHEHLLQCWQDQAQSPNASIAVEDTTENPESLVSLGLDPEPAATALSRKVDLVITKPENLDMETLNKINQLSPFGSSNPEPVFRLDGILLVRHWTSGQDGRHLRVRLRSNNLLFNGTLLRGGARAGALKDGSMVQVIFSLEQAWSPPDSEVRQEVWFRILDITPLQRV